MLLNFSAFLDVLLTVIEGLHEQRKKSIALVRISIMYSRLHILDLDLRVDPVGGERGLELGHIVGPGNDLGRAAGGRGLPEVEVFLHEAEGGGLGGGQLASAVHGVTGEELLLFKCREQLVKKQDHTYLRYETAHKFQWRTVHI